MVSSRSKASWEFSVECMTLRNGFVEFSSLWKGLKTHFTIPLSTESDAKLPKDSSKPWSNPFCRCFSLASRRPSLNPFYFVAQIRIELAKLAVDEHELTTPFRDRRSDVRIRAIAVLTRCRPRQTRHRTFLKFSWCISRDAIEFKAPEKKLYDRSSAKRFHDENSMKTYDSNPIPSRSKTFPLRANLPTN